MSSPRRHLPVVLKGAKPGLLDPTQAERILGSPHSTLSFAIFSPGTAGGHHPRGLTSATLQDIFPSKRIVVETLSGRVSQWRFVPNAIGQPGVDTEGNSWPKVVDLCGQPVIVYEEQWDIYNLDPAYECEFLTAPGRPIIRLKRESSQELPRQPARNAEVEEPSLPPAAGPDPDQSTRSLAFETPQIRQETGQGRGFQIMEVDETPLRPEPDMVGGQPVRGAAMEPQVRKEQQMRQERGQDSGPRSMEVNEGPLPPELGADGPVDTGRKASSNGERLDASNSQPSHEVRSSTRAGADAFKGTLPIPVVEKRTSSRREDDDGQDDGPQSGPCGTRARAQKRPRMTPNPDPRPSPFQEKMKRYASQYAENAQKAQELRDKKLVEELQLLALQEEQRVKAAEEEEQRVKAAEEEEQRAKAAQEKRRAKAAEEEERRAKAAAEAAARAAAEEEEQRAIEQARLQEIQRLRLEWSEGEWTASHAFQRYMHLFEDFKTCTFLPDRPIAFDLIPWPVLWEPRYLSYQTPTWQAVEEFFKTLRHFVPAPAYGSFLTQAKLHFHPDRLTGRRILSSLDERDHDRAREGFSIVVQAVGSLITELKET